MSARRITSALKLQLPTVSPLLCRARGPNLAFQSSNCYLGRTIEPLFAQFVGRVKEAEAEKAMRHHLALRCYPKTPIFYHELPDPVESSVTCVLERRCTFDYRVFENLQLPTHFSPKPDLFLYREIVGKGRYFTAISVEEGGNFSPKYDIYPPFPSNKGFFFRCGYNGLFCFENIKREILLSNPKTNEFKILPKIELPPRVSNYIQDCAIWFDHKSQDYKVLSFVFTSLEDEEGPCQIYLYSLKTNSRKKFPCTGFAYFVPPGACLNGVYYCDAYRKEDQTRVILSFDFSTETISSLPLPNHHEAARFWFLEYNGLLSILDYFSVKIEKSFQLWVMMDGSWTRESVLHTSGVERPLCFWKCGEMLFLESLDQEILVFDRATGKLKHLGIYGSSGTIRFIPFFESFVQLSGVSDLEEREKEAEEGPILMGP